jgi:phage major head subunit gpT-like protein
MLTLNEIDKMSEAGSLPNSAGKSVAFVDRKSGVHALPQNVKAIKEATWNNNHILGFRESIEKKHGFDLADSKAFPVMESKFSWKKVAQKCGYRDVESAMREADSGSSFTQLLRAGVQTIVNNMYLTVPTTFESWTKTVASTKDTELYAPLHGVSFLREVGKQEIYSESRAAGLDLKLKNRKYGTIFAVEKELLEDDQTGQFAQQAGLLGEYCRIAMEVIVMAKLAGSFSGGALANYAGLVVPNTETKPSSETNYPFTTSAAPFVGGGYNRPTSFGVLNQANIQNGFIGLMNQLNLLGLKMTVDPDTIIVSPKYRFDIAVLLNSSFYPSQPGSAGTTGTSFAINPIESIAKAVVSRFMFDNTGSVNSNSSAWYVLDSKKPFFIVQTRESASVTQENPQSGQSFDRDVVRFRCDMRGNADYIDPRFIWQGSDGSA